MTTKVALRKIRLSGLAEALLGTSLISAPSKEWVIKENPILSKHKDKLDLSKKDLVTGFVACDG